jgi:MFS transporter, ACS family, tartrate transporter
VIPYKTLSWRLEQQNPSEETVTSNFENAVMRKVAWHLIPFLSIGYMINALDRFNVSMAALTMNTQLGLTASEYGLAAGAFFWSYVLFQFPANLMLARVGARVWISIIMAMWASAQPPPRSSRVRQVLSLFGFSWELPRLGFFPGSPIS